MQDIPSRAWNMTGSIALDRQPTLPERRAVGIPDHAVCVRGSSLTREFVYEWTASSVEV